MNFSLHCKNTCYTCLHKNFWRNSVDIFTKRQKTLIGSVSFFLADIEYYKKSYKIPRRTKRCWNVCCKSMSLAYISGDKLFLAGGWPCPTQLSLKKLENWSCLNDPRLPFLQVIFYKIFIYFIFIYQYAANSHLWFTDVEGHEGIDSEDTMNNSWNFQNTFEKYKCFAGPPHDVKN